MEFHSSPFTDPTLAKLRLYKSYIHSWLPVFMNHSSIVSEIWVYDLFCGPGCDCNGVKGSPLILLDELEKYLQNKVTSTPPPINIIFNDKSKSKINNLKKILSKRPCSSARVNIHLKSMSYEEIFKEVDISAKRKDTACFIFIDQCGINAIEDMYLKQLADFPRTDWLAFVASSHARRFIKHANIKLKLKDKGEWRDAHRSVADTCRIIIDDPNYYIVPFSIKNKSNIYGLVFGSGHPLGAEKFINACWNEDKNSGEANFDIDGNVKNPANLLSLLPSKKLDAFEIEFEKLILEGQITNTKEAYIFALQSGVKSQHAKDVLKKMKKNRKIKDIPTLSYSTTIQKKKVETITVVR